ncbi:MAG: hypothetical protein RR048_01800 [Oscillospiraceae bacterium]
MQLKIIALFMVLIIGKSTVDEIQTGVEEVETNVPKQEQTSSEEIRNEEQEETPSDDINETVTIDLECHDYLELAGEDNGVYCRLTDEEQIQTVLNYVDNTVEEIYIKSPYCGGGVDVTINRNGIVDKYFFKRVPYFPYKGERIDIIKWSGETEEEIWYRVEDGARDYLLSILAEVDEKVLTFR